MRIKIGIIGFGRMGRKFLNELQQSPLWEVMYICDKNEACRELASKILPGAIITDDEDNVFSDPAVDVVGLFALSDTRYGQIIKGMNARKHIIAEKPVALTIEQEWDIARRVEHYDKFVTVNLFNRNAWYHHEMIKFIRSGEIGEVGIIRVCHMTPGLAPNEGHIPEGPPFHDCGMHYVDLARWYAESEYETWHAQGIRMWNYAQPWWIQVHGTFKNGVVFDITQGFVYGQLAKEQTHNSYVDIIGTKGIVRMSHDFKTATIDMHGVNYTVHRTDDFKDKKIDVLLDVFARSILVGRDMGFPHVKDSVIASEMAWKLYNDAIKNPLPAVGNLNTIQEINERRAVLKNGYGLLPRESFDRGITFFESKKIG